jgi:branched-chain amino acid transport system substrate-binding protein
MEVMRQSLCGPRLALLVALAALLAACGQSDHSQEFGKATAPAGRPLVLGVSVARTGDDSGDAERIERGVRLAVEEGGAIPVDVRVLDDGCSVEGSVAVAKEFAAMPEVVGVVGPMCSRGCIPASLVYDEAKLVMVTPSCTASVLTNQRLETVFRVAWNGDLSATAGGKYAVRELKARRVYAVNDGTFYGKTQRDAFKVALEDRGGELIADETISAAEWDFTYLVRQIQAVQPDLIYFGGFLPAGTFLIQQLRYAGVRAPFMAGDALMDRERFIVTSNTAAAGAYITDARPLEGKRYRQFAERYRARWGEDPGPFSAYGYDAARALLRAVAEVAHKRDDALTVDRHALRDELLDIDFEGATGRIRFFPTGDRIGGAEPQIVQVQDDRFVSVRVYQAEDDDR